LSNFTKKRRLNQMHGHERFDVRSGGNGLATVVLLKREPPFWSDFFLSLNVDVGSGTVLKRRRDERKRKICRAREAFYVRNPKSHAEGRQGRVVVAFHDRTRKRLSTR